MTEFDNVLIDDEYKVVKVTKSESSKELFKKFYLEVFEVNMKDKNEYTSLEDCLLKITTLDDNSPNNIYLLINKDNDVISGLIFDYFHEIKCIAVEFIVVDKDKTCGGIAKSFLQKIIETIPINHQCVAEWLVIEMDNPVLTRKDDLSYLYFWNKIGMKIIDFHYVQPPISEKHEPVDSLLLCVKNFQDTNIDYIPKEILKKYILSYSKHAISIDNPEKHPIVSEMITELDNKKDDNIKIYDFASYFELLLRKGD